MSDEVDMAQEKMEIGLAYAIRVAQQASDKPIVATGKCLYCDEITGSKRWCDAFCRSAYQKLTGMK